MEIYNKSAQLGKKVQRIIRSSDYTQAEKSDIVFYVLFAVVAKYLNKTDILFDDIIDLDVNGITDDYINRVKEIVYNKYKELGGNGRVAKSSNFINQIEPLLEIQ